MRRLLRSKRQRVTRSLEPTTPRAAEIHGDADDDYLLALLVRLHEVDSAQAGTLASEGAIDFVLPQSRELYRTFGAEVPQELEPYAERARQRLPERTVEHPARCVG